MTGKVYPENKKKNENTASYLTKNLSQREVEVLTLSAKGKTYADISMILRMSESTVKDHIERIGQKLGTTNKTHSVAMAVASGLIKF